MPTTGDGRATGARRLKFAIARAFMPHLTAAHRLHTRARDETDDEIDRPHSVARHPDRVLDRPRAAAARRVRARRARSQPREPRGRRQPRRRRGARRRGVRPRAAGVVGRRHVHPQPVGRELRRSRGAARSISATRLRRWPCRWSTSRSGSASRRPIVSPKRPVTARRPSRARPSSRSAQLYYQLAADLALVDVARKALDVVTPQPGAHRGGRARRHRDRPRRSARQRRGGEAEPAADQRRAGGAAGGARAGLPDRRARRPRGGTRARRRPAPRSHHSRASPPPRLRRRWCAPPVPSERRRSAAPRPSASHCCRRWGAASASATPTRSAS